MDDIEPDQIMGASIMREIEEVIGGLNCLATNQHKCLECPYNPSPGMKWPYGCIKGQADVVGDAVHLIRQAMPRAHGYWIPVDDKNDAFDCSECVAMVMKPYNYCPRCGAEMEVYRGEERETGEGCTGDEP